MANTKITDLTEIGEAPASTDVLMIVDVSDTSMAASGTNKKIYASRLVLPGDSITASSILPRIQLNMTRPSSTSVAPVWIQGSVLNTTTGINASSWSIGAFVNSQSGTLLPTTSYMFIGAGAKDTYANTTVKITPDGKFGIGVTSANLPLYELDVVGTAKFTGAMTIGGTVTVAGATTLSSTLTVAGTLGTGWTSLSLGTGWVYFGSLFSTPAYKKHGDMVYLRGVVKRTSGSGTLIGTLPAGYRPVSWQYISVDTSTGSGRIYIKPDGSIELSSGGLDDLGLDNITFSVA